MATESAGLGQKEFNRDFKVVHVIGQCNLDRNYKTHASNRNRCREREQIYVNIEFVCTSKRDCFVEFDRNGADNNENHMDVQTGLILKEDGRHKAVLIITVIH